MARLDAASKADPALVLPGLVLAKHLHVIGILPSLARFFHVAAALEDTSVIRLSLAGDEVVTDSDVVPFLLGLSGENKDSPVSCGPPALSVSRLPPNVQN